ncbi:hypothetical protein ACFO60_29990 [Sphaerisporangium dianthi]|uniref:DNA-binding protein n=2 Tax=Sphaerisporangium dianthi TaxID=1436120 RepID=A0ABV9CQA5_9ACTN
MGATAGVAVGVFTPPEAVGMQHVQELRAGLRALRTLGDAHGYLHFDACDQETARRYWNEGLAIGTTLDDAELKIQSLAMLDFQANYENRPRHASDLLGTARRQAEALASPVLESIVAGRQAHAMSLMGDHSGARAELARAMRLMERPQRGRPAPDWTAFYDRSELEVIQARLYTEAGRHKAAVPYFRASVAHTGASYGRNRAVRQFVLAHSLVRADEVDEGAAMAVTALGQLHEVSSGRVRRRVVEVRDALASVDSPDARQSVQALTDHLN